MTIEITDDAIPYGYCHCGCGQKTSIIPRNNKNQGLVKGEPRKFVNRHHTNGARNVNWKGGKTTYSDGYVMIRNVKHARADANGRVREHILVVEKAIGRHLKEGEEIHHVDEHKSNNDPSNLVLCPDRAYHMLLHVRMKALKACGHTDWRKCYVCGQYDKPSNLVITKRKVSHKYCGSQRRKE